MRSVLIAGFVGLVLLPIGLASASTTRPEFLAVFDKYMKIVSRPPGSAEQLKNYWGFCAAVASKRRNERDEDLADYFKWVGSLMKQETKTNPCPDAFPDANW